LNGNIKSRRVKSFKKYLCSLFSMFSWIQRSFRQQYWVLILRISNCRLGHDHSLCWVQVTNLFGRAFELFGVNVVPNLFHILPVLDYSMLHWILDTQQASHLLRFLANVLCILVTFCNTGHQGYVFRSSNAIICEFYWESMKSLANWIYITRTGKTSWAALRQRIQL
jgi:hypothetical protein